MARFGCYACHSVRGQEAFRSEAPPLATDAARRPGRVAAAAGSRIRETIDPNATMPNFQLTDKDDRGALALSLRARKSPRSSRGRDQGRRRRAARRRRQTARSSSPSRAASRATPSRARGTARRPSFPRSPPPRAAAGCSPSSAIRRPSIRALAMPRYHFSDGGVARRRGLHGGRVPRLRRPEGHPRAASRQPARSPRAGEKLFRRYGCFSCHGPPGARVREKFGPDLDGIGDKRATSLDFGRRTDLPRTLPAWLAAKIESPRARSPNGLKMPSFGFSPEESQAVVTAPPRTRRAAGARAPIATRRPAHRRRSPPGASAQLIDRYRCLSCHQIGDRGGDISTAPLTFEGSKVQARLARRLPHALLHASGRSSTERMPVFRMPREEAVAARRRPRELLRRPDESPRIRSPATRPRMPTPPRASASTSDSAAAGATSSELAGGYYGPPLTDSGKRLRARLDLHVAQGAAALASGRALPRLRPDRPGRAATDRLHRDPAPAGGPGEGGEMKSQRASRRPAPHPVGLRPQAGRENPRGRPATAPALL